MIIRERRGDREMLVADTAEEGGLREGEGYRSSALLTFLIRSFIGITNT